VPTLLGAELEDYLAAPLPLPFWRKKRGLTQVALAASSGISPLYLAQIETGKRTGDVVVYRRIAKRLGVRTEDLLGGA
jgi:transcriptional regulator with XRE-family HTH domain